MVTSEKRKVSRRAVLRFSVASAGATLLAGCGATSLPAVTATASAPTTAPAIAPAATPTTPAAVEPTFTSVAEAPAATNTAVPVETPVAATPVATAGKIRWSDRANLPGVKEAIERFTQENPGMQVTFEPREESGFLDKYMAQCVAGTAPDLMEIEGHYKFMFADKGQLLDVRPSIEKDMTKDDVDDFYPWHWPTGWLVPETGVVLGLPWKINVGCLIYNKDIFDEVALSYPDESWDYDRYAAALLSLVKKDSSGKIERYGGYANIWYYTWMTPHVQAWGGHVVDPKDRTKCRIGEKPALDALEWIRARLWDDQSLMGMSVAEQLGWDGPLFVHGKVGIFETGLHAIAGDIAPELASIPNPMHLGITHMPKGPAERAALGSSDGWVIYKGTKFPDATFKLMHLLTQDDYIKASAVEKWGQIPPRKSQIKLFEDIVVKPWQEKGVDMSIFAPALQMGYFRVQESFVKQQEALKLIEDELEKIFVLGGTPVSAMVNVCEQIDALHKTS